MMSGGFFPLSRRFAVWVNCPQSTEVRLIVTFGYLVSYALTALATHFAASPDQKSSIARVTEPAFATSIEVADTFGAVLLALLPWGAQPATVSRPNAAPDIRTVRLVTISTPLSMREPTTTLRSDSTVRMA